MKPADKLRGVNAYDVQDDAADAISLMRLAADLLDECEYAILSGIHYARACDTWPASPHEAAAHKAAKARMRDVLARLRGDTESRQT